MDDNLRQYLEQSAIEEEANKNKYRQMLDESKNERITEYMNPAQSINDIGTTSEIQNVLGQTSNKNPLATMTGLNQIMQNIGQQSQQGATENIANKIQYKTALEDVLKKIALTDYLGQTERTLNSQLLDDTLENKKRIAQNEAQAKKDQAKKQFMWNLVTGGLAGLGQGLTQGAVLGKELKGGK